MKLLIAGIVALLTAGALAQQPVATCADPLIAPSGGRYGITPTRRTILTAYYYVWLWVALPQIFPSEDADFLSYRGFSHFLHTFYKKLGGDFDDWLEFCITSRPPSAQSYTFLFLQIRYLTDVWCDQPIDDTPNRAWCNFFFAPKTRVDLNFNSKDDPKCRAGWACRTIYGNKRALFSSLSFSFFVSLCSPIQSTSLLAIFYCKLNNHANKYASTKQTFSCRNKETVAQSDAKCGDNYLDNIYETSYVNLDDADAEDESEDSSSSGDDEDFTRFYSKFTVAQAKWAEAEAKLRATHTGSSRWTEYRKTPKRGGPCKRVLFRIAFYTPTFDEIYTPAF